jgi:hypothetical protein
MADQAVCQELPESQMEMFQMELPVMSLWSQLAPARQRQLAQVLAEIIRRIREGLCQEVSCDEGQ